MNSGLVKINPQTKIAALIKANEMVVDVLSDFNPHFNKLRNLILRKLLAGRVSIEDACKIAGCRVEDFMTKMTEIGFEAAYSPSEAAVCGTCDKPAMYADLEEITLDVRSLLARKEDPLKAITKITANLGKRQCLKLINSFEPIPLISLLAKKGFTHFTEHPEPDVVITWFVRRHTKNQEHPEAACSFSSDKEKFELKFRSFASDKVEMVDVRELEMPLPMLTILSHLENLPEDRALFVLHKKVPVYLLPELKERGFKYILEETPDEKVNMLIYRT